MTEASITFWDFGPAPHGIGEIAGGPVSILDRIDSTITEATTPRCVCGCNQPLGSSPSPWYATEDCQTRYLSARADAPRSVASRCSWYVPPYAADLFRAATYENYCGPRAAGIEPAWMILDEARLVAETDPGPIQAAIAQTIQRALPDIPVHTQSETVERLLGHPMVVTQRSPDGLTMANIQSWLEVAGLVLSPWQADVIRNLYARPSTHPRASA